MVLGPKGGVWWFLLLAGALLAAAAVGAAQEDVVFAVEAEEEVGRRADDQGNDMCDIKCQHWHDARDRRRCVNECHSREHHHPSREFCEMKCQHHQHDPSRMELCVQQCMTYGLNLLAGGNNGIHENPEAWEVEVGRRADDQGNDVCDIKCEHWHDARDRRRCVNECHSREHHHPNREFCEMKCQHHQHDPSRMELCVQQCMSYGLNLLAGGNNGIHENPEAWEAEVGRRADDQGNDVCDIKCQHWHDARDRRRCVNECHSREHHHPSREFCEMKCQHHQHDPSRMELCVQQCMSYGLNLHADSNNGGVDQHPHRWGTADGAIAEVV